MEYRPEPRSGPAVGWRRRPVLFPVTDSNLPPRLSESASLHGEADFFRAKVYNRLFSNATMIMGRKSNRNAGGRSLILGLTNANGVARIPEEENKKLVVVSDQLVLRAPTQPLGKLHHYESINSNQSLG
jgi:hypothetical protein